MIGVSSRISSRVLNFLYPSDFSRFQAHLDTMRMGWRTREYILNDSLRKFAGSLILLQDDRDLEPRLYVRSFCANHTFLLSIL